MAADVVAFSPTDGATTVLPNDNLVLTFSDDIRPGPGVGRILIKNAADDSVIEAVRVDDPARVTFAGHAVTVDPVNPLPSNAKLYVTIDAGAIRDLSTKAAEQAIFREDFETTHLIDSDLDKPTLDNYALFLDGTLDVQTAGSYRFGMANAFGAYLAIDLNGDGQANVKDPSDVLLFDDTTHGIVDSFADRAVTLAKGQYKFEFMYFAGFGPGAGEVFYAADNGAFVTPIEFDAAKFAVVGDASHGIGLTADLIQATTYAAGPGIFVGNIQTALDLRAGDAELAPGFPASGKLSTADVWDSGQFEKGHYGYDNLPPGGDLPDPNPHNYAPNMPFGWTKETNLPQPQPEYNGWTQLDKNFWIAQQGSQGRDVWELGQGTVAVMDPDAFSDFATIPNHNLEAYTTLPPIHLTDIAANSVRLDFDSSFRPETPRLDDEHPDWIGQTGLLDVSFDGGATWDNVLLQNTETAGGQGSLEHANEHLTINIPNPAGGSLLVRFGIVNATNDWWWAIDNIKVTGNAVGDLYEGIADRTTWNFTVQPDPLAADFNDDGRVDLADFGILKQHFAAGTTHAEGDADGDADVDLADFGLLKYLYAPPPARTAIEVLTAAAVSVAFAEASEPTADKAPGVEPLPTALEQSWEQS
ncbi:MAG: Ig-like domain-containing protein [Pirellulales bacterium]